MNKTELKTVFKNYLVLLECHNEQKRHISDYFKSKGVRTLEYPFFTADYSFMIMPNQWTKNTEPLFYGEKFLIERKSGPENRGGGFQELWNNLMAGHKQFKAEFQRMNSVPDVTLLIENTQGYDCMKKVPRQKTPFAVFKKIYDGFIRNRNKERLALNMDDIKLKYCSIEESGELVMKLIFEYLSNEFLKK